MTPRIRNMATGGMLPLIMVILSGCCSTDREIRAAIRMWTTDPSPEGSRECSDKFFALLDRYQTRLIAPAFSEAATVASPEQRSRLIWVVRVASSTYKSSSSKDYRDCLTAIGDGDRLRSLLGLLALSSWMTEYKGEVVCATRMARDLEALTESLHPWTRAYAYTLLGKLEPREEHVASLLLRAANEDPSFAVRIYAALSISGPKAASPDEIKSVIGVFETVSNPGPPYVPTQTAASRDALVNRLAVILRSDQPQQVEGIDLATIPYEADQVDLKYYAAIVAGGLDLQELIPEIKPLVEAPDPILRSGAERALDLFEQWRRNR